MLGFAKKHLPISREIYDFVSRLDFEEGDDFFCFKSGGDGDNGEMLMDYLDEFFKGRAPDTVGTALHTCHMSRKKELMPRGWYAAWWECDRCGFHYRDKFPPDYCPGCGAKVVSDDA